MKWKALWHAVVFSLICLTHPAFSQPKCAAAKDEASCGKNAACAWNGKACAAKKAAAVKETAKKAAAKPETVKKETSKEATKAAAAKGAKGKAAVKGAASEPAAEETMPVEGDMLPEGGSGDEEF